MPDIIEESNEPVNLAFVLDSRAWRKILQEKYNSSDWIEGVNHVTTAGSVTIISLDEISSVENNDLAFAGNNDYISIPIDSKWGMFEIRIPFARDHFRVWRFKRVGKTMYIKGSATYDQGFRVGDVHVTDKYSSIEALHGKFKQTINRAHGRNHAVRLVKRVEIGHLVTEFTRTRLNSTSQFLGNYKTFKKAESQYLNPTGKEVLWTGLITLCY